MEAIPIITRALERVCKEARGSRHEELREACAGTLVRLKEAEAAGLKASADEHFEPFRLAMASQHAGAMDAALDGVQKLIAYGLLSGAATVAEASVPDADGGGDGGGDADGAGADGADMEGADGARAASAPAAAASARPTTLIDVVVKSVCACNDYDDDQVQLQVIKCLLTAVTAPACAVHEATLLLAVRSCYNIHLVSRNINNKVTAKATLTQMLAAVFTKMEVRADAKTRARPTRAPRARASAEAPDCRARAPPYAALCGGRAFS